MKNLLKSIFLIFFILFFCADFVLAEEITITTYYPSPYGSYNSLQTDKLGVGDNNNDGAWTSADVPTTSGEAWIKGNVGIGTPTLVPLTAKLTVVTNNNEDSLWYSYNNGNNYDFDFIVNRARGTSEAPLAVNSANNLGSIRFHGYDGANFINGAEMEARVDGTPGINDMPAKLIFATTPDGASDAIERMVIKSDGKIGIGTLDPKGKLHIQKDDLAINWATSVNGGMWGDAIIEGGNASLSLIGKSDSLFSANIKLTEVDVAGSYRDAWVLWRETNTVPGTGDGDFHITYVDNLTKFWHKPEMFTIKPNGNVGIGTQDPKDALHVAPGRVIIGDIGSLPPSTFDSGSEPNTLILSGNNRDVAIVSMGAFDSSKADLQFYRATGSPASPANVLSTTQLGKIQWAAYYGGGFTGRIATLSAIMDGTPGVNDYPTRLEFSTTSDGSSSPQVRMVIKNNGNVGIGTEAPNAPLHVFSSTSVGPEIRVQSTEPTRSADLHVQSDGREWSFGVAGSNTGARSNKFFINDTTAGNLDRLVVDTIGNVGIGTTNPGAFKMYINGTGFLNAAAWVYGSDRRLKENISYIQSGLSIIEQLKPARFDYIKGDKKQAGFIAQEVEKVLPDIVTKGEDGMLGMKTESIIPYLVNAIQEQQGIIKAQQFQIDELKARLDKLEGK